MDASEQIQWFSSLEDTASYMAESSKLDFAKDMLRIMELNNLTQAKLAKIVGASPAYICKVLRGDANLTIETMTKFAHALGQCLHMHLASKDVEVVWMENYNNSQVSNERFAANVSLLPDEHNGDWIASNFDLSEFSPGGRAFIDADKVDSSNQSKISKFMFLHNAEAHADVDR